MSLRSDYKAQCSKTNSPINIYILLDSLVCSIMRYFMSHAIFWRACRTSKNIPRYHTVNHSIRVYYLTRVTRFKRELSKCKTRMHNWLMWLLCKFSFLVLYVADWSKMQTCQTSLLSKSYYFCQISRVFYAASGAIFQTFARKTEMEWQIILRLMTMSSGSYVKPTARTSR